MSTTNPTQTPTQTPIQTPIQAATTDEPAVTDTLVVEDLIEEVSIDGMCGVY